MDSYNFITPIDEKTCRYYWFQLRNFAPSDEEVSRQFAASVRFAFEEDRVILQALQIGMDNKTTSNIDIKSDRGPKQFRRHLTELIAQEQAQNVVQIPIKVVSA